VTLSGGTFGRVGVHRLRSRTTGLSADFEKIGYSLPRSSSYSQGPVGQGWGAHRNVDEPGRQIG